MSGTHMVFRKDREYDLLDEDAEAILEYEYTQDGKTKKAFEVVHG